MNREPNRLEVLLMAAAMAALVYTLLWIVMAL